MPANAMNGFDVAVVVVAAVVTIVLILALLYWIDQEWRERDRRERG